MTQTPVSWAFRSHLPNPSPGRMGTEFAITARQSDTRNEPHMKLSEQRKVLPLLLLAFALILAPQLHSLAGCGDDEATASAADSPHHEPSGNGTEGPVHHNLPNGACCALDLGLDCFAYNGVVALTVPSTDSIVVAVPIFLIGQRPAAQLVASTEFAEIYHPPPLSTPIFIALHSLLI